MDLKKEFPELDLQVVELSVNGELVIAGSKSLTEDEAESVISGYLALRNLIAED